MREIAKFNQMKFLSDVMDIDGWQDALHHGCCTVLSAYFLKLAQLTQDISDIDIKFKEQKSKIAELQQQAVKLHEGGWDGYGHVLNEVDLKWSGNVYTDPRGNFARGQCALCLITYQNGDAHTIAILYHQNQNCIYIFDPNIGIYAFDPDDWYQKEFREFINQNRGDIRQVQFNNVIEKNS